MKLFVHNLLIISLSILVLSCVINTKDDTKSKTKLAALLPEASPDTSKIQVVGIPYHLDSTDYIFHPVGWENQEIPKSKKEGSIIKQGASKLLKSSAEPYYGNDFYTNSDNEENIYGNMSNLIIEDLKTGAKRLLTDSVIRIENVHYLKSVAKETNRYFVLYKVRDKDYNGDGKLNLNDLASYYVSNMDGTNFTKIGGNHMFFNESKLILTNLKYYFRATEDVNRDGIFDGKDIYRYFYVDFSQNPFKIEEYNPLDIINQTKNLQQE